MLAGYSPRTSMHSYSAARTLVSPLADADRPWRASLVGASAEVQQHDQHSRSRDVPKGRKLLTGVASPKGPFAFEESLGAASATAPPRSAPDFRAARQHLQDVHPARLTNAFAKVDLQRKGQLGLSDFASVLRSLRPPPRPHTATGSGAPTSARQWSTRRHGHVEAWRRRPPI